MLSRADDLGKLTVQDEHGASIPVASLWANGTVVLAFLRHFG